MKIIVEGLAANYFEAGHGPVALLLHGWGIKAATFDQLAHQLAQNFRVVAVDLPGFGASERAKETWGVVEYAHWVKAFLAKLGVTKYEAVIGHSFGGRIALLGTARGILAPRRVVLMSTPGVKASDTVRARSFRGVAKLGKLATSLPPFSLLRQPLRRRLYHAAGSTDYLQAGALRDVFLKVINQDLQADAAKLKLPVLMIYGEQDVETPIREGRQLAGHMPKVEFVEVKGANHFVYLDQPERTVSLIKEFLNA